MPTWACHPTRETRAYGIDVMTNNRRRVFLAGVLVGALAIAGYAVGPGNGGLPGLLSSVGRHDDSATAALDSLSPGASRSGPVDVDPHSDETFAQIVQAIRDSLKRNDLASARSLLNGVQSFGKDDKQVLALQKDLQVREKRSDDAGRVASEDKPQAQQESAQVVSGFKSKQRLDRLRNGSLAIHRTREKRAPRDKAVDVAPASSSPVQGAMTAALPSADSPARIPSTPISPPVVQPVHVEPAVPTARVIQPGALTTSPDQAPKTRAQVRAELEQARDSGMLPRFGNPDPAGPGRTPNSVADTAASPGHE
jgi:hypothetical protein